MSEQDASPTAGSGTSPGTAAGRRRPAAAAHWLLDPAVRFLNHGSFGACPRVVLAAQQRWRERYETEPVAFVLRELEAAQDAARAALAELVGARADDLVFVTNASAGVATVLASLELAPGDELLVTDHVYNACRNAALARAQAAGARVVTARVPFPVEGPGQVVDAVLGAVTARTRLALIEHVTSPTAVVFPVAELVAGLAARGVATLVDGAHAPGMLPLDLNALGADYYTANCHKWLCSPKGAAFLHVRADRQERVRPLVISHGGNSGRSDRSRFQLEFGWTGTDDPSARLCVPDALAFLDGLLPGGLPGLMAANHDLALAGRDLLCATLGIEPPVPDAMLGSMAAVPLPAGAPPAPFCIDPLQERLWAEHRIEVPVTSTPDGTGRLLRISCQAYNGPDDYEALAAALADILGAPETSPRRGGTL